MGGVVAFACWRGTGPTDPEVTQGCPSPHAALAQPSSYRGEVLCLPPSAKPWASACRRQARAFPVCWLGAALTTCLPQHCAALSCLWGVEGWALLPDPSLGSGFICCLGGHVTRLRVSRLATWAKRDLPSWGHGEGRGGGASCPVSPTPL